MSAYVIFSTETIESKAKKVVLTSRSLYNATYQAGYVKPMKILMLGWELPPHNSGGLGVACYQLCKTLAQKGADIEFIVPYTAQHNIPFMKVTAAHPQSVTEIQKAGIAYDSYR